MAERKLILVTNDDGLGARGIAALTEAMLPLGEVVVVAPSEAQSGMSQAITVKHPLRVRQAALNGCISYAINGTPTDCVKLAFNQLLVRKPDLLVSGINHGSNSSTSVLYSGTLGAALEGAVNGIPSIGFSLLSYDQRADLEAAQYYAGRIAAAVLKEGLPKYTCLNVNVPEGKPDEIKGARICRQTRGHWQEEFDRRTDPAGREYYWLTGKYFNSEPDAEDTDEWALHNNYVAVVPLHTDLTSFSTLEKIKNWKV
ncbi:MAG: 5'/3'-nucleotidase SurE [Bacteroidales bacterium]|nr:5'/3'-nucleotidase SurE [Bacteroidales bacterium]